MKYVNAQHILPEKLIQEIQQYVQGETLYIPKPVQARQQWGSVSGGKKALNERNESIRKSFKNGCSIDQLAKEYYLAPDTIRKIVYSTNK